MTETMSLPSMHWKRVFFTIWIGQAFSLLGSALIQFSLVWWVTQTTGSATVLAMSMLAAILPEVLVGPFVGALVDRWNRRWVMILSDTITALCSLALVYLFWSGTIQVWHMYIFIFIRALCGASQWSAMQASTSLMVPPDFLSRLAGINQALRGAISIAAPAMGAFLLGVLPMFQVLAIDILTALLAVVPLLFLSIPQPVHAGPASQVTPATVLADVRSGLRYVSAWPGLMGIMIMAALLNFFFAPTDTLLPLLVTGEFNGGVWQLGLIQSVFGVGIVAGGLLLGAWGGFRKRIYTTLAGLIGLSAGVLLVGLAPGRYFSLAVAGMALSGVMNPIANGPLMAIVQARVAPEMQGRVFTLLNSAAMAMMPLSMLVAGPLADALGVRLWYWLAGGVCMLMGVAAFGVPAITAIEDERAGKPLGAAEAAAACLPAE